MKTVLDELRKLMPLRELHPAEAIAIAEEQAERLLAWRKLVKPPVPTKLIHQIPRLEVEAISPLGVSGAVAWTDNRWQMVLNADEPLVRQRFSSFHELKHVLDHPFIRYTYPDDLGITSSERQESIADYFAASVLMPKSWLQRAWQSGRHSISELAHLFDVSKIAMRYRLTNLGYIRPRARCEVGL